MAFGVGDGGYADVDGDDCMVNSGVTPERFPLVIIMIVNVWKQFTSDQNRYPQQMIKMCFRYHWVLNAKNIMQPATDYSLRHSLLRDDLIWHLDNCQLIRSHVLTIMRINKKWKILN